MTLIKDLIHIPQQVNKGDFVINLAASAENETAVLADYVVTPQLVLCFQEALTFIRQALEEDDSKGTYLHGSFGSGKSHFMAVLSLMLQANTRVFAHPDLQPALHHHQDWIRANKLLMVPLHMLDANSMETALFGGYVNHVHKHHPDAPEPGVYRAQNLLEDAANLRRKMGDATFFKELNQHAPSASDQAPDSAQNWGEAVKKQEPWHAQHYDEVAARNQEDRELGNLIGLLVTTFFPNYRHIRAREAEAFVTMDQGLAAIARHAEGLGYQGIVLFLDELVLWLMSHRGDPQFVGREINKITKLQEFGEKRAVPIISFIARQRALTEMAGEHATGTEKDGISKNIEWWSGRFHTITLEDRNLTLIAEKRILKPRPDRPDARERLRQAFADTHLRREMEDILLTTEGDRDQFERIYPFTPALLQALVELSAVLQRERTALKVMYQLLVNRREELRLGDLIPMGDLYDAVAEESQPFSSDIKKAYSTAKKMYTDKLLPIILESNGLTDGEYRRLPPDDPKRKPLRADEMLAKTLIMAALTPSVPCFQNLTAARLVALNPGVFTSAIPRRETQTVINKLRAWAAELGNLKISDDKNPIVSLKLLEVDVDEILEAAREQDTPGQRLGIVRKLVWETELNLKEGLEGLVSHDFLWRGTSRPVSLSLENVRELPTNSFKSRGLWKLIIDYPFDDTGHSAQEDVRAIENARNTGLQADTVVWLPNFFSKRLNDDLGKLVVLEYLCKREDNLRKYTHNLSELDRHSAKVLLNNLRDQLNNRILLALRGAFGIGEAAAGTLSPAEPLAQHCYCFRDQVRLGRPVGTDLGEGAAHLIEQVFDQLYPNHPHFGEEVKKSQLIQLFVLARDARHTPDGRVPVEKSRRKLLTHLAVPLQLATANETYFVPNPHWERHFDKAVARHQGPLGVEAMRTFINQPQPLGMPTMVEDLLIRIYCENHGYKLTLQGTTYIPDFKRWEPLNNDAALVREDLPDDATWARARRNAQLVLGLDPSPSCTVTSLMELDNRLAELRADHAQPCSKLHKLLIQHGEALQCTRANRIKTAEEVSMFLGALHAEQPLKKVLALADMKAPTTLEAMSTSLNSAGPLAAFLEDFEWSLPTQAWKLPEPYAARAAVSRDRLCSAFNNDEFAEPLIKALTAARNEAADLLSSVAMANTPAAPAAMGNAQQAPAPPPAPPQARGGQRTRLSAAETREAVAAAQRKAPPGQTPCFTLTWTYEVDE